MSALFSTFQLDSLTLRNRIIVAPMCQYSAHEGAANSWHLIHLGHLALSGAALLFIEATAVEPDGRITPGDLGLWDEKTQSALQHVISEIRGHSLIKIGLQIAHAGRKASTHLPWDGGLQLTPAEGGWQTAAPSSLPFTDGDRPPTALNAKGLQRIREAFVATARRADAIGIDVLEVHSAHGYLLHEFLSPLSNVRSDEYGGSLEARMRFPLEVFTAVRAAFPAQKPVGVRISATDWVEGGWDIEQSIIFSRELQRRGCAFIDVSSGSLSPRQKIAVGPNYQVPFAQRIKKATGIPVFAVGLITEPQQADEIISMERADMVGLARAMLYDPRWPWHAAAVLGGTIEVPSQYLRAAPHVHQNLFHKK